MALWQTPHLSELDFWKIEFEKSSWMNLIFLSISILVYLGCDCFWIKTGTQSICTHYSCFQNMGWFVTLKKNQVQNMGCKKAGCKNRVIQKEKSSGSFLWQVYMEVLFSLRYSYTKYELLHSLIGFCGVLKKQAT